MNLYNFLTHTPGSEKVEITESDIAESADR